jgi:hypothetical protein
LRNPFAWAFLSVGVVTAYACGGDDEPAPPATAPDAGRDGASDTGVDRAEAETGNGCSEPRSACGVDCVDLSTDDRHCGRCENACGSAAVCSQGTCVAPCAVDQARCLGQCVSLATDNANCGQCGERCADGLVCSGGTCRVECVAPLGTCPPDGADAGPDAGAGDAAPPGPRYCADFTSDERNCGGCSVRCAPGQECVQGQCNTSCVIGQTECSGTCRDLATDGAHCGRCENACAAGEVCSGGTCQPSCGLPYVRCTDRCANVAIDPENCGDCGRRCEPRNVTGPTCVAGRCGYARCSPDHADCDGIPENGCERPVGADPLNCGFCNNRCQPANVAAPTCGGGACGYTTCAAGFDDCDSTRQNGCETLVRSDNTNCGGCGVRCGTLETCQGAKCVATVAPTSYVSPGGAGAVFPRARNTVYTLAAPGTATIHYTTNGLSPRPGMAGTASGPSPLTLPALGPIETNVRWFADYGNGLIESTIHSFVHSVNSSLADDLDGHITERVNLNGKGPVIVVPPNAAITGTLDYQQWKSPNEQCSGCCGTCPNVYAVNAADDTSAGWKHLGCVSIGTPLFPGRSGMMNVSFNAPTRAGSYRILAGFARASSCSGQNPGGEEIGRVIVQP